MASSSAVSAGDLATADQFNALRSDILDGSSGHDHDGTDGNATLAATSLGTLTALTVDDVAINGKVVTMTGSSSDTAVFTAGTNGTLSIVTTDAAAAAANIQITADGTVDIDSAGVLTLDSGAAINIEPASGSAILLDGTISIDAGVVTGVTSITLSGELVAATLDISGSADIAGDLVLSGGADGALQFTNAGENSIKIPDNQASALIIEEADNAYITFVTTNSSEAITVAKATTFSAGIANSGTIAAGTWNGTDIGVAYGGTGASSLTDGGVLLGSGTGAITAMAVLADSEMIVGDGTTDPVAESGATLRTSIGVGTGNSPQFTGIELGHASDTTIVRSGSGDITIEGNAVYRAGGTDVPVADGGTGASSLTDGGVLLGSGTNAVTAMAVLADSEMIVGDGTTDPVAESGATLRTSIGVGTGDSPQFTDLTLTDDLTLNSDASVFNMGAGNDFTITHDGSTGATIAAQPVTITSAAASTWSVSSGQLTIDAAGGIVINEDGDDEDFRIESDDDANMFVVNAGDDRVGIGIADPAARLDIKSAGASTIPLRVTDGDSSNPEMQFNIQGDGRGWLQIYQNNTEKIRFDGGSDSFITNNLGVGVTSSISHILHISGQGRSTSSAWATSSDERIKTNIQDLSLGLDTIMGLRPRLYDYNNMGMSLGYKNPKSDPEDDDTPRTGNIGFVAQEVEAVLPQAVQTLAQETVNKGTASEQVLSNFKIIDSSPLVPILVKAVQEAVAKINALDARIKILEA